MKDPREVVVRNLFLLRRLENELGAVAESLLSGLADEIAGLIAQIDPTGTRIPRYRRDRAAKLLALIEERIGPAYEGLHREIRAALAEVGREQARRAGMQLTAILGRAATAEAVPVSLNTVKALLDTNPIQGALLKDWFADQGARTAFRVRQQINLGVLNGETIGDMVRRVRGKADGAPIRDEAGRITGYRFTGGVMQTSTREATAIVRTAVNHVSNEAQRLVQEQNADIAPTYTIVATLDSRTSPVCQARDGETYRVDDPKAPRPPFHVACRTITVPNVDWAALGITPPEEGTRASAGGQVAASVTYGDWLREQPLEVQQEILGPGRADLFRAGKISLKELVRTDGRRVRLTDLRGSRLAPPPSMQGPRQWERALYKERDSKEARAFRKAFRETYGSDPEADAFFGAVERWAGSSDQRGVKENLRAVLAGTGDDPQARAMLRAIARADAAAPVLFRGMYTSKKTDEVLRTFTQGAEFDWLPSSFTSDIDVAKQFAREGVSKGQATQIMIYLESGAKAVPIESLSILPGEREWITAGRFTVVRSKRSPKGVVEVYLKHAGVPDVR